MLILHFSLFTIGPVDSFLEVRGVVGHSVTLPCTYPISSGISSLCWDRGACASNTCRQELIWSDQPRVYNRLNKRYRLMGQILLGNVSLTIENATESDSGLFCCKLQIKRRSYVQRLTISLKVQPGKPALFLCLFLASERSPLFATNLFFLQLGNESSYKHVFDYHLLLIMF